MPAAVDAGRSEAIGRYFEALTRKDWDALAELCTEDVEYHVPGSDPTHSRTAVGRDALRRLAASAFADFADAIFTVVEVLPLPAALVGRYRARWTSPAGAPAEIDGAVLFHFRGEAISSIGVRLDLQRVAATMAG
jgi:ketosteroid isomerase-like protein